MIKFFKKLNYRFLEEDAAVRGHFQEALYWGKKGQEL